MEKKNIVTEEKFEKEVKDAKEMKDVKVTEEKKETAKKAPKKTVTKKAKKTEKVFIQCHGKEYELDDIMKKITETTKDAIDVKVYIKPENEKAYFVADGVSGSVDIK